MFGFGSNKPKPLGISDEINELNSSKHNNTSDKNDKNNNVNFNGFDPTGLERAAKAARELEKSKHAKEAFNIAKELEKTKQMEYMAKTKENEALYKAYEIQRITKENEEKRKNMEEQTRQDKKKAQYTDQLQRKQYADQLSAQKYMKEQELKKQEEIAAKQEAMRRKTLEYEAELRQKTEMARVAAEMEGQIKKERLNHDLHLEKTRLKAKEYRETVLESIQLAGTTIGNGIMKFISDKEKVVTTVTSLSLLALGIYSAKVSTSITGRYIESRLGKPSLVRETSRVSFNQMIQHPIQSFKNIILSRKPSNALEGVILEKNLDNRLRKIAISTYYTKKNHAPFRHILLHGPPGTGKTLFAKALAKHSGLEYAILTGGDVAPLGKEGVTEIHKLFDWSVHSRKGLLLFVDEADAFLQKRNNVVMSEDMRNALNAFLYRTGEATDKFMIVFASNQPEQFDWAINDRIDEMVEFSLPSTHERYEMLKLYYNKYILQKNYKYAKKIQVPEFEEIDLFFKIIANKLNGFSGREISKLVIAWQADAYSKPNSICTIESMEQVLNNHFIAHKQKEEWKVNSIKSIKNGKNIICNDQHNKD